MRTKDKSYDVLGLKPGGRHLKVRNALKAADSWAYFACDLVGVLPKEALDEYYK
jgi:hypothetical protein